MPRKWGRAGILKAHLVKQRRAGTLLAGSLGIQSLDDQVVQHLHGPDTARRSNEPHGSNGCSSWRTMHGASQGPAPMTHSYRCMGHHRAQLR